MTLNENNFKKVITDLRRVSLSPEQKQALFAKLERYAANHQPAPAPATMLARILRSLVPVYWRK